LLQVLQQLQVRASLTVPILRQGEVWGVLIAHQCDGSRVWEEHDIEQLQEIIKEFNFTLQHAELVLQQRARIKADRDLLRRVVNQIRNLLNLPTIYRVAADELRGYLQADRVILYQFNEDFIGTVIAESVGKDWQAVLGQEIFDTCFQRTRASQYTKDLIIPTSDVQQAGLSPCYLELLEKFQVRANLVLPIFKENAIWGLLIAHQCSKMRVWEAHEIEFCHHTAAQISIALLQLDTIQKLREQVATYEQLATKALTNETERINIAQKEWESYLTRENAEVMLGELNKLAKLKTNFIETITHELRMPLSNIKLAAAMIKKNLPANDNMKNCIEILE
jgi:GAF domain-containing protein